jgi:LAO/AO transport system kinase
VPVLTTEALLGEGIAELEAALVAHHDHLEAEGGLAERRRRNLANEVVALAAARWRAELEARLAGDAAFEALLDEVVAKRLDPVSAARRLADG